MSSVEDKIRRTAADLLAEGRADLVIGFCEGTLPMRAAPCFVTKPDAARRLVWNSFCANNLAAYLPVCFAHDPRLKKQPPPPKVAIIVKGCDGRSVVGLVKELQAPRENLIIIAAPCDGMLDATIAQRLLGNNEIVTAEEAAGIVTVTDDASGRTDFKRDDLLAEACRFCTQRAPAVYDIAVGELPQPLAVPSAADLRFEEFSKKSGPERWDHLCRELSKCILCKACRSACPNCYCKVCFADQTRPNWTRSGVELRDVILYHLGRIFHQAGRCVDCGACVRACPQGVDLRMFTQKLVKDATDLFDYSAGLDIDEAPLLTAFSPGDPEGFITEPE